MIGDQVALQLTDLTSGRISLPGGPVLGREGHAAPPKLPKAAKLYPVRHELGTIEMDDEEIHTVDTHLSRCGIRSLKSIPRAARRGANEENMESVPSRCHRRGIFRAIDPPKLTGRSSMFCGEIVVIDVA